jgi:manganese transport protein
VRFNFAKDLKRKDHKPGFGGLEIIKYIGPGLLVTVGFIDPGNWGTNLTAGSTYGYSLLWIITLSTIMLVMLQHNVAHLGIATGLCLSEAAQKYLKPSLSIPLISSAMVASISTSLAEILGGAIALNMLFGIPMIIGAIMVVAFVLYLLLSNTYRKIERWIIGLVSLIGISFIYELTLVDVHWSQVLNSWVTPVIPKNSIIVIMSVLGAVVMPHNLFLHSEVIQSRQWNLKDEKIREKQLKFEFTDTLLSMTVGWAINSAMIIMAASTFYQNKIEVTELSQANDMLVPLLGRFSSVVFAVALLLSGISALITSGMAGGSIFAGFFGEPLDLKDNHSRMGVYISIIAALGIVFFIGDPLKGLIVSQIILSIQLPFTIFLQIYLTSSRKVMGVYANTKKNFIFLLSIGLAVTYFNLRLLYSLFFN